MSKTIIEIEASIKNNCILAAINSEKNTSVLILSITRKFLKNKQYSSMWEKIDDSLSVYNKEAWRWINDFIGCKESIMFFSPEEESLSFTFQNGIDIVKVLEDTYGFEFYVTNKNIEYLLCFNHHNMLIACGTAKGWLQKYSQNYS